MVERFIDIEEVGGPIPPGPTMEKPQKKEQAEEQINRKFLGDDTIFKLPEQSLEERMEDTYNLSKIMEQVNAGEAEIGFKPEDSKDPKEIYITDKKTGKLLFHEDLAVTKERREELDSLYVLIDQHLKMKKELASDNESIIN